MLYKVLINHMLMLLLVAPNPTQNLNASFILLKLEFALGPQLSMASWTVSPNHEPDP